MLSFFPVRKNCWFQLKPAAYAIAPDIQPYGWSEVISCQFERSQVGPDERQTRSKNSNSGRKSTHSLHVGLFAPLNTPLPNPPPFPRYYALMLLQHSIRHGPTVLHNVTVEWKLHIITLFTFIMESWILKIVQLDPVPCAVSRRVH